MQTEEADGLPNAGALFGASEIAAFAGISASEVVRLVSERRFASTAIIGYGTIWTTQFAVAAWLASQGRPMTPAANKAMRVAAEPKWKWY